MTKAKSYIDDNGGRCESCNRPESAYEMQEKVDVFLGGGLGNGTMWKCKTCIDKRKKQDAEKQNKI